MPVETDDIDDIEPAHGDALEHDQAGVPVELGVGNQMHQLASGIVAVLFDLTHQDAVQPVMGEHRPHDLDRTAMTTGKRGIIKSDDIGETLGSHGMA